MSQMPHRQRVLMALNHQEPDRVPIDFGSTHVTTLTIPAYEKLKSYLNFTEDAAATVLRRRSRTAVPHEALLKMFEVDCRGISPGQPEVGQDKEVDNPQFFHSFQDEYQVIWSRAEGGHYINTWGPFEFIDEPKLRDLERFAWPNPNDPGRTRGVPEEARRLHQETDYAVILNLPYAVVGISEHLRGFDRFLEDLIANPAFATGLMEYATEVSAGIAEACLKEAGEYIGIVFWGDDLGMQSAPLMSPALYRKMVRPHHQNLVQRIKRAAPHVKVLLHSDGCVWPLIKDLIEIGVDALNPVQVSAAGMDTKMLKREFGRDITFWGGVDTQRVLPWGTVDDVRAEVRQRIDDLAPGGGYVLASVHNIQDGVPPANLVAMLRAAKELGRYGDGPLAS